MAAKEIDAAQSKITIKKIEREKNEVVARLSLAIVLIDLAVEKSNKINLYFNFINQFNFSREARLIIMTW